MNREKVKNVINLRVFAHILRNSVDMTVWLWEWWCLCAFGRFSLLFISLFSFSFFYSPLQILLVLWNSSLISSQRIVFNIILIKAKENKNFSNFKKLRIKKSWAENKNEYKKIKERKRVCLSEREGTRGKKTGVKLQ